MSELSIFKNNALANSDLFKSLQGLNDNLAGGGAGGTNRRISIKGSKFREIVNGEQVNVSKDDSINIVIVDAAPVSRTYYEGEYDSTKVVPPTCWSKDTQTPAQEVPKDQRQSAKCIDCPMNVKGSGQGNSRACRFSQRIAVAIEGKLDTVYQLQLAATSVFGDAKNKKMPMQAYARYLRAHSTPAIAVVTEMYFDEDSDVPKLFFKPIRPLSEEELEQVVALRDAPETKKAIDLTVYQTDTANAPALEQKPSLFEEAEEPTKKVEEPVEEEEEEEAPKRVVKKSKAAPKEEEDDDLSDIVSAWDDDE
jgi:hypothetical protein